MLEELEYIRSCGISQESGFTRWLSSMKAFWMKQNRNKNRKQAETKIGFLPAFPLAESVKNLT